MDEKHIKNILIDAVGNLFKNQPNISEFTSETGQTEWNLAHHLANEIHALLPELDCDLDLIKINFDRKRPDIVFHKRGSNQYNVLVVEVKRDGNQKSISDDIEKIQTNWFQGGLNYQFGAVVNLLGSQDSQVEVFKN